jgi:uncharacterized membrane protein
MMSKRRGSCLSVIILVIGFIFLFVSNPSEKKHKEYLEKEYEQESSVGNVRNMLKDWMNINEYKYNDWVVISVLLMNDEPVTVGIAGKVFSIRGSVSESK